MDVAPHPTFQPKLIVKKRFKIKFESLRRLSNSRNFSLFNGLKRFKFELS